MNSQARKKILVAMSGGVDSSVAALLLKEAGHSLTGITMCLGIRQEDDRASCCGGDAIEDAKKVCHELGIPHFVFDFAPLMEEQVIGKFTSQYLQGRTPNPCVDCNQYLKFGSLLQKARGMGFDALATGHYARIENHDGKWRFLKPADAAKDQTYFLYPIAAADLPSILFPLGSYRKEDVRRLAQQAGLPVASKPESQDICFTPGGDYGRVFSDRHISVPEGEIVDEKGTVLGRHRGIIHYTIGQRGGLGISAKRPLYVLRIDADSHRLVVGHRERLFATGLVAGDLNLFTETLPEEVAGKIRYRKKASPCRIRKERDKLVVQFSEPQESVTPGQAFVFYKGDELLGGGVIEEAIFPEPT